MNPQYKKTRLTCYIAYIVQALINNFLPILFIIFRREYNLSYEKLGRIIFINFFVQFIADAITPLIVKKIGYKGAAILCQGLAAAGLILLSIFTLVFNDVYIAIISAVIIYAFGSGVIEVIISPIIELLPTERKAANMAFLHSFYCWGQVLTVLGTTLMVMLFGSTWQIIPAIWAIIPFCNTFLFMRVLIIEPDEQEKIPLHKKDIFTREFFCFAVFMICAGASEIAMSEWASVFAQQGLGVSKIVGDLLGPCAFAVCMGTGRVVFGVFSGKYSQKTALIINNLLCCACYIGVALLKAPLLSLAACAFCGFTVSLSWPGTYSMAAARFPKGGTLMFSIFALCGDLGCSTGPWLLGAVADRVGLNNGFLVCAVFPLTLVIAALILPRKSIKNS